MLALNPEFITWHSQDQMILSTLITSLSETILVYVVKCATSHNVWTTLEHMFTAQSRARSMSIHSQLATLCKDIYGHLLSHELRLSHNQPSVDLSVASANFVNKAPPFVVAVVVEIPIPPLLFVDAVASIIKEEGGVVDLTSPLLPIALFAKCVTNQGMWRCNVITDEY
uniref:Uncharacterized protein n=1 Tax=Fagus sylvatica TaxID=28930 RepID=A0A2N9H272_FAGSY